MEQAKPRPRPRVRFSALLSTLLLSAAGTAANYAAAFITDYFKTGLFLDTIFTISVTFSGGLVPGLLTAFLYTATRDYPFWGSYLFGMCSAAAACLTYLFVRAFPGEFGPLRIPGRPPLPDSGGRRSGPSAPAGLILITTLIIFSLAMCVLMSVLGGLISWFIQIFLEYPLPDAPPETYFKLGLLRQNIGLLAAEILARFPVNILDRIISVFIAYGTARLLKRCRQSSRLKIP